MAQTIEFHPKGGVQPLYRFIQNTLPRLRQRNHVLEIKEFSPVRSNTINGYYFKIVVGYFITEMGIPNSKSSKKYIHEDVLGQELRQIPDPLRHGKTMTQRTSNMTGSEFWKYLNQCDKLFQHFYNYNYPSPINAGYDPEGWER